MNGNDAFEVVLDRLIDREKAISAAERDQQEALNKYGNAAKLADKAREVLRRTALMGGSGTPELDKNKVEQALAFLEGVTW